MEGWGRLLGSDPGLTGRPRDPVFSGTFRVIPHPGRPVSWSPYLLKGLIRNCLADSHFLSQRMLPCRIRFGTPSLCVPPYVPVRCLCVDGPSCPVPGTPRCPLVCHSRPSPSVRGRSRSCGRRKSTVRPRTGVPEKTSKRKEGSLGQRGRSGRSGRG